MKVQKTIFFAIFFLFTTYVPRVWAVEDAAIALRKQVAVTLTEIRNEIDKKKLLEEYQAVISLVRNKEGVSTLLRKALYDQIFHNAEMFHYDLVLLEVGSWVDRAIDELPELTPLEKVQQFFMSSQGKALVSTTGLAILAGLLINKYRSVKPTTPPPGPNPPLGVIPVAPAAPPLTPQQIQEMEVAIKAGDAAADLVVQDEDRRKAEELRKQKEEDDQQALLAVRRQIEEERRNLSIPALLKLQEDPKEIAQRFSVVDSDDGKVFTEVIGEQPMSTIEPILMRTPIKFHTMTGEAVQSPFIFIQLPSLYQGKNPAHTNYCGYYALYNGSRLSLFPKLGSSDIKSDDKALQKKVTAGLKETKLLERSVFAPYFEKALSFVKKYRNDNPENLGKNEHMKEPHINIPEISEISFEEINELTNRGNLLGINASKIDRDGVYEKAILPRMSTTYWDIIKVFAYRNKDKKDVARTVCLATTKLERASHWQVMSIEKVDGVVVAMLMDSLGINRAEDLKSLVNEDVQQKLDAAAKELSLQLQERSRKQKAEEYLRRSKQEFDRQARDEQEGREAARKNFQTEAAKKIGRVGPVGRNKKPTIKKFKQKTPASPQ